METSSSKGKEYIIKADDSFDIKSPDNNTSPRDTLLIAEQKIYADQNLIVCSVLCDFQGNIIEAIITNAAELNMPEKNLVGLNLCDFLDENMQKSALQYLMETKQTGKTSGIVHVKLINGEERSYEYKNVAVYDGDKPVAVRIFAWCINYKIMTKQALVASESHYRGVFENTGLPITIIEENLIISMVNVRFEELSGYAKSEIEEKIRLSQFIDEESNERILKIFLNNSEEPPFEYECAFANRWGEIFNMIVRLDKISSTRLIIASFIDITSQKRIETELLESRSHLQKEVDFLRSSLKKRSCFAGIIGKSHVMQDIYEAIVNAAEAKANVIIYGESGTGKELVARAIHQMSNRKDRNFVTVNCGAIPESIIESEFFGYMKGAFTGAYADKLGYLDYADGGTLFLDEVGELNLNMQVKLLRVIDGSGFIPLGSSKIKKTDLRIIAATHRDLKNSIKYKSFREDFFYRIHIITIHLPPLRERKEDIPLLIDHFIKIHGGNGLSVTGKTMDQFIDYDWPGNVRELENVIQRYLSTKKIDFTGLRKKNYGNKQVKTQISKIGDIQDTINSYEKEIIESTLNRFDWHRAKTASALRINRKTLFLKMKKYGLQQPQNRGK
ncbi:MAG: sigma-54-dependent Fis family transcriptional regulator [Proteobacteria bacterium]|nr:sigma-54-dependent Fis family transcriptional regulator [Pseudomonadota bacterium]